MLKAGSPPSSNTSTNSKRHFRPVAFDRRASSGTRNLMMAVWPFSRRHSFQTINAPSATMTVCAITNSAFFASARYAPARFAPVRFAPVRFASARYAPARFAPVRFASARFASARFAPARYAPASEGALIFRITLLVYLFFISIIVVSPGLNDAPGTPPGVMGSGYYSAMPRLHGQSQRG